MTTHNPVVMPTKTELRTSEFRQAASSPLRNRWGRTAAFVIAMICAVGAALVGMIQFAYSPSITSQLFVALPPIILACVLPLWALTHWLAKMGLGETK